jgi:DNA-binding transcriptional regulator YiaG
MSEAGMAETIKISKRARQLNWAADLVSGRQLRAARVLAGLSQVEFADLVGVTERTVRHWEACEAHRPTNAPMDFRIKDALLHRGVILLSDPAPGARLACAADGDLPSEPRDNPWAGRVG